MRPVIALLVLSASCSPAVAPRDEVPDADPAVLDGGTDAGSVDAGADAGQDAGRDAGCTPVPADEACALLPCGETRADDGCGHPVIVECSCDGGTNTETLVDGGTPCVPKNVDELCRLFPCSHRNTSDGCGGPVQLDCGCDGGPNKETLGRPTSADYCKPCDGDLPGSALDRTCGITDWSSAPAGGWCRLNYRNGTTVGCSMPCLTDYDCPDDASCAQAGDLTRKFCSPSSSPFCDYDGGT